MKKWMFAFSFILLFLQACSASDDNLNASLICDHLAIVDNDKYRNAPSEKFFIRSVQVTGDCLEVAIQAGGCSGNTWKVDLIDAGTVAESYPEQRALKIILDNEELCEAFITRTYTFDLRPVRTNNEVVLLNLELWEEQIRYEY